MGNTHIGISRQAVIINELGLHARSAAKLAKIAMGASGPVWIEKNGEQVDASSVIDILTLACSKNTKINIIIENQADMETLVLIEQLIKDGFGE